MKKILFTLLLVAGSFGAQAQNTFHYGLFTHGNGNIYARLADETVDAPCYNSYDDAQTFDYELTSANRFILLQDGVQIANAPATPAIIAQFNPAADLLIQVTSKTDLSLVAVIPSSSY